MNAGDYDHRHDATIAGGGGVCGIVVLRHHPRPFAALLVRDTGRCLQQERDGGGKDGVGSATRAACLITCPGRPGVAVD